jgi:hypothetical protein
VPDERQNGGRRQVRSVASTDFHQIKNAGKDGYLIAGGPRDSALAEAPRAIPRSSRRAD